jgi:hypothetical protein
VRLDEWVGFDSRRVVASHGCGATSGVACGVRARVGV